MNLILFGFKRCGKTYFGQKVAEKLKMTFIDTDVLVENLHGEEMDCREIFNQIGEAGFRSLERDVVMSLQNLKNAIISVGGGVMLDRKNLDSLEDIGRLVYLDTSKEILKKRMLYGELAAYLDEEDPEGSFNSMYDLRKPIYESIKAERIDTSNRSDQAVIQDICRMIHGK